MAIYKFTGTTSQFQAGHVNFMLAVKVDPTGSPMFTILDQVQAGIDGTFTLQWEDWSGRVLIGAVDDEATEPLDCDFRDFKVGTLEAAPTYEQVVYVSGPALYYKLDETTGTTAADSSGNSNDGTYINGPLLNQTTLVQGEPASVSFDGVDDYLVGPTLAAPSLPMTIEYWAVGGNAVFSHSWDDATDINPFDGRVYRGMSVVNGSSFVRVQIGDESGAGSDSIRTFNWTGLAIGNGEHIVAIVRSTTDASLYIDSVDQGAPTLSGTGSGLVATSGPLEINREKNADSGGGGYTYFGGTIDEVAIYNKELTPQEIQNHYLMGKYGSLTVPYNELVLFEGPLVYYKLDETSGTTATDSSSNANDGTYTNGPTLNQASLVQGGTSSVSFDGVDDFIQGPNGLLGGLTDVTLEAWIKVEPTVAAPSNFMFLCGTRASSSVASCDLETPFNGNYEITFRVKPTDGAAASSATSTTQINDGNIHHIVGVRSGTNLYLYVDNVLEGSTTVDGSVLSDQIAITDFTVGRYSLGWEWDGLIDEVVVYDKALTAQEIRDHYYYGVYGSLTPIYNEIVLSDAPVAYYKLDETSGTTASDSSGNTNNGTYIGSPTLNQTTLVQGEPSSVSFDGVDDGIDVGAVPALQISGDLSLECWIDLDTIPVSGRRYLFAYAGADQTQANNYQYSLSVETDGSLRTFHEYGAGNNEVYNFPTYTVPVNTNTHIVVTRDVSLKKYYLYADGIYTSEVTYVNDPDGGSSSQLFIGKSFGSNLFDGHMDEIAIYDRVLTPAEIRDHYDYGVLKQVSTDGLLAYWKFDESVGSTTVADSHGTFDGTATSTAIRTADGKFGNALVGDGTNWVDLAATADLLNIQATSEFTFAAWVYVPSASVDKSVDILDLNFRSGGLVDNVYGLRFKLLSDGEVDFRVEQQTATGYGGSTNGIWRTGQIVSFDEWNLVIVDRTNSNANAYIYNSSGVSEGNLSFSGSALDYWDNVGDGSRLTHNSIMRLANGSFSSEPTPTDNKLDSTFAYNRVLSKQERDGIWNLGVGKDL